MFCVVWDYSNSKQKNKQYKLETSPKSYKTEIEILAGLTWSGFEKAGPVF